ncbi:hypothetical protein DH2020_016591 [Rehmannia glutinosa]|uniref:Uncharacterized protein n=1 Tax=Rehmannia glutinosa TaxID=99300 RepID=A0ABR0WQ69_REHGL
MDSFRNLGALVGFRFYRNEIAIASFATPERWNSTNSWRISAEMRCCSWGKSTLSYRLGSGTIDCRWRTWQRWLEKERSALLAADGGARGGERKFVAKLSAIIEE